MQSTAVRKAAAVLTLEDLVREAIERAGQDSHAVPGQGGAAVQEVVLEVEVDGASYTLTRRPCEPEHPRVTLSPREKEIVRMVAQGLPSKTIAATLDLSLWTVSTHLRRVFAKLSVNSRAEMVAQALQGGLIDSLD